MERRGKASRQGDINRAVQAANRQKAEELKNEFLYLAAQKDQLQNTLCRLQKHTRQLKGQQKDLAQSKQIIAEYQKRLTALKTYADSLGFFAFSAKEVVIAQIKYLERCKDQATKTLKCDYGVAPEKMTTQVRRREALIVELVAKQNKLVRAIEKIEHQQETLERQHTWIFRC